MKVNFKNSLINNMPLDYHGKLKQSKAEINTNKDYIKERPAQAISFSGSAISLGQKFVENKWINKTVDFVKKNEACFTTINVFILSGLIKPVLTLNSKGSDEKDKQLLATKHFISALIGLALGKTVGGGIVNKAVGKVQNDLRLISIDGDGKLIYENADGEHAKEIAKSLIIKENTGFVDKFKLAKESCKGYRGKRRITEFIKKLNSKLEYTPTKEEITQRANEVVNEFNKNRKQIFERNPEFVKKVVSHALPEIRRSGSKTTFYEAFESFWKNSPGWITAILKAKVTSYLLPTVTALIFANRVASKLRKKENDNSPLLNNNQFKEENEKFKIALNKTTKPINFTGKPANILSDALAVGIEKVSMTKPGESVVTQLAKFKKPSPRMLDLESFIITGYWLQNTARSKKIEPDQKLGLNIQTALVTAVSFVSSLLVDKLLDKPMAKIKEIFKNTLTNNINEVKTDISNGVVEQSQEAIEEAVKTKCKNLAGSGGIAKAVSKIDLSDTKALGDTINHLTDGYEKKVGKLKSLVIFTFIVRFLMPILMVPVGGNIKKAIKNWQEKNKKQEDKKA